MVTKLRPSRRNLSLRSYSPPSLEVILQVEGDKRRLSKSVAIEVELRVVA